MGWGVGSIKMLSTEMWICHLKGGSILLPALFVDLRRAVCCVQEGRPEPAPAAGPQAGRAVLQEPQESPARVRGLPRAAVSAATPQRSAARARAGATSTSVTVSLLAA